MRVLLNRYLVRLFPCAALALALSLAGGAAHAVVIDFESLPDAGTSYTPLGSPYSEAGFQFANLTNPGSTTAFGSLGSGVSTYAGSKALYNNYGNGITELTRIGGGSFDLVSMDLAEFNDPSLTVPVTFTGDFAGGGTVTQSLTLDQIYGFETVTFAGFTDLVAVRWTQQHAYHQFDNIVLDEMAVPEPGTLAITGLGLAALGLARRRRG